MGEGFVLGMFVFKGGERGEGGGGRGVGGGLGLGASGRKFDGFRSTVFQVFFARLT